MGLLGWTWKVMVLLGCQEERKRYQECRDKKGIWKEGQEQATRRRSGHRQGQETRFVPWIRRYALVLFTAYLVDGGHGRPSDLAKSLLRIGQLQPATEATRRIQRPDESGWQTHGRIGQGQTVSTAKDPELETQGTAEAREIATSLKEEEVSNVGIPRTVEKTVAPRDAKVSKGNGRDRAKHQGHAGTMSQTRGWRRDRDGDPTLCGYGRRPGHAFGIDEFLIRRCSKDCTTAAGEERDSVYSDAVEDTSGPHDESSIGAMVEQPFRGEHGRCRHEPRIAFKLITDRSERKQKTENSFRVRGARDNRLPQERGSPRGRDGLKRMRWQQGKTIWLVVKLLYNKSLVDCRHTPENSNIRPMLFGCSGSLEGLDGLTMTWRCHPIKTIYVQGRTSTYKDWYATRVEGCTSLTVGHIFWRVIIVEGCTSSSYIHHLSDKQATLDSSFYGYRPQQNTTDAEYTPPDYIDRMIWILRLMMVLNKISVVVITLTQSILTIGRRLCFLQFDKGKNSTIHEMLFQYVRVFFWMCCTFVYIWSTTRRRGKSIKTVQKRRYSVLNRSHTSKIKGLQIFLAVMVFNSHVVHAIHQIGVSQHHGAEHIHHGYYDKWRQEDEVRSCGHSINSSGSDTNMYSASLPMIRPAHSKDHRLFEGSIVQGSPLDTATYDLPNTIGEALTHPRTLRMLNSWNDLQMLLTARGQADEEITHYHTYGLRGNDRGVRTTQIRARQSGDLIGAIQTLWHDEILDRSFQIHIINPQPVDIPFQSVALLVEIYDMTVDVDFMAPILMECIQIHKEGPDTDHVIRTDYAPRRSTAEDFYDLGRVARLCPPSGNMQCQVETATDVSFEREDRMTILSGFYVVIQVTPGEWYEYSCDSCFHGMGAFAREAYIMITDPIDPYVYVRTFAAFAGATRAEQRGFLLHRRFFHDVETVWNMVAATWSDRCNEDDLRVIYSPTPPQVEATQEVTLMAIDRTELGCFPVAVTFFGTQDEPTSWSDNIGTFIVEVPPNVHARTLLHQLYAGLQLDDARIWCEDNFYDGEDSLPVEPGSHVLVYVDLHDGTEEEPESSIATEDPIIDEDNSNGCASRIHVWFIMLLGVFCAGEHHDVLTMGILLSQLSCLDQCMCVDGKHLDRVSTPANSSLTRHHRLPDEPIPGGQTIRMCPMPQTPIEAWEQRPPRTGVMDYDGLRVMLSEERIAIHQPAILDTYGLQEHSVGYRRVTIADLQQRTMALAIAAAWNDYSFQFSLIARVVRPQPRPLTQPQPILILIIQILDPFIQVAENAVPVLIDQVTSVDMDDARQAMTTRVAEYVPTPTHGQDIAALVRMGRSCQPKGLRQCHISWRGNRYDMQTPISPRASEYIVLTAGPLGLHFRGADNYFYRARRFALDGQRLMSQLLNVEVVDLEVHAVSHDNEPLGARVLQLRMGDLIQPQETWRRATELWRDKGAGDASKLYHVDSQPSFSQQPPADILHVILVVTPHETLIPTLFGLTLVAETTDVTNAYCARLCSSPSWDTQLLRDSRFDRLARTLDASFAIYSGYHQVGHDHQVGLMMGIFLHVQIHHRSRSQILHNLLDLLDEHGQSMSSEGMSVESVDDDPSREASDTGPTSSASKHANAQGRWSAIWTIMTFGFASRGSGHLEMVIRLLIPFVVIISQPGDHNMALDFTPRPHHSTFYTTTTLSHQLCPADHGLPHVRARRFAGDWTHYDWLELRQPGSGNPHSPTCR